jgi:inner membrane protein
MVYHFSKNKSLYFNDLRFGLLNDSSENPQFAFSYEFIITESEQLKSQAKRDGKRLLLRIANRLKETNRPSNSLFTLAVIIV